MPKPAPKKQPVTRATPFAEWTKNRKAGARLTLAGAADDGGVIVLKGSAGERRDQIVALLRDAPKDVREAAADGEANGLGDVVAKVTLSTARVDSYDSTIAPEGWDLADYKRNPVVLFAHDSFALPVGRDMGAHVRAGVEGAPGALVGVTRFVGDGLDEFGAKVGRFVAAGILRTVSVGFEPLEFDVAVDRDSGESVFVPIDFTRQRLREYSWVPVPANPDCLVDNARLADAGIAKRDVVELLERAIEGTGHLFVPRSELIALRRHTKGSAILVDLGKRGSFRVEEFRAPVVDDDGVANPEAYAEDENAHPEDPEMDAATEQRADPVMLQCPECGAVAPVEDFAVLEPDEVQPGEGEAEPMSEGSGEGAPVVEVEVEEEATSLAAIDTAKLAAELARRGVSVRVDDSAHPGEDADAEFAAEAEELADMIEDEEMRRTGRLP